MKFILQFIFFALIITTSLLTLVISVDPYEKLGFNPWGFKSKAVTQSRQSKFLMLDNSDTRYQAFILGSSAAHRFATKDLKSLTLLSSFNYAVQHTTPEDYLAIVRHIIDKKAPGLILLQIGFAELDQNYKTDNRLFNSSLFSYLRQKKKPHVLFDDNYFTLQAINDSLKVIYVNNWGKIRHEYLIHGDYRQEKTFTGKPKIQQSSYPNWTLSQERVEILRKIKKICQQNNIKLIVFTAPLSYEHYKVAISSQGYNQYIQALQEIFGSFWNFHHESIKEYDDRKYFHNSTHMTKDFSKILLERMLSNQHSQLGNYVTNN